MVFLIQSALSGVRAFRLPDLRAQRTAAVSIRRWDNYLLASKAALCVAVQIAKLIFLCAQPYGAGSVFGVNIVRRIH